MAQTGIQFIDSLRQSWRDGTTSQEAVLDRLLPWEDDLASRTAQELEAAWALRQELEAEASSPPDLGQGHAPEAATSQHDTDLQQRLADLRANPLLSREDLVSAHALCARLLANGASPDEDIRTRCGEVSQKVEQHVHTVQHVVEEATKALHDSPSIEDKLRACDLIQGGLADIEMLRPDDPTLPDMIAWSKETRHELEHLLAERSLLLSDISGIANSEVIDVGLIESSKQRLIVLSDKPLSKDDIGLRKAARDLTTRLNAYLSGNLQPGTAGSPPNKGALDEYEKILHLAKQSPEAISADQARAYNDLLTSAQAELTRTERGSEPALRSIPTAPPPQPRSTTGSQPNTANTPDSGSQPQPHGQAQSAWTTPQTLPLGSTQPASGSARPMPPPPPPRVQPGMGQSGTQPTQPGHITHSTQPIPGIGSTLPGTMPTATQGPGTAGTLPQPPPPRGTTSLSPSPPNAPSHTGGGLPVTAWIGIAVGVVALLVAIIVTVLLLSNRGGGTNNPGGGGGGDSGASSVAQTFYRNVKAHNYQAAVNLLTPELANRLTADTLRTTIETLEQQQGAIQSIDVSNVTETGDTAQATVTVQYASGNRSVERFTLQKMGGRWLISNIV